MVSLKQIAGELDISYTLVSKVLRGKMGTTGASEKTREAIFKKAKELGYRPNAAAVALKTGRRGAVGVFFHQVAPGSGLTEKFITGAAEAISKGGMRILLRFFMTDQEFLTACDDRLRGDVDGLIVAGAEHSKLVRRLQQIDKSGFPIVTAFAELYSEKAPSPVNVDYEMQCFLTTTHLLEQGCRRLAHFRRFESRYGGFVRAHREMKVPVVRSLVIPAEGFSVADGECCAQALLDQHEKFDGIVAQSDSHAMGALRVLTHRGIRVPEDVKLTGVDDSLLAEASLVPLTSSTAEMEQCGRVAAEVLLKKIEGKPTQPMTISPRLAVRDSSRR
ncbi:MAG: LacI family DNA-binding transcriptional regulator [Chthoniobacteraceae bacterium]